MGALVAPADELEQVTADLRTALAELSVPVVEAILDRALALRRGATATESATQAVLITTTSEDEDLWRAVDRHRSRLEDNATTLFVLNEGAATTLQRTAPNLRSLIGTMQATEPRPNRRLATAIEVARAGRYLELYEAVDARDASDLDEAISTVLDALGDPRTVDRAWWRFGFMGRAALIEVIPTISAHWPPGVELGNAVLSAMNNWLSSASPPVAVESLLATPLAPQALAEAMGVVESAAHLMHREQARAAMSEMLDLIFEGYAIFPGREDRRALFNWWLDEVAPAAAALRAPHRFHHRVKSDALPR